MSKIAYKRRIHLKRSPVPPPWASCFTFCLFPSRATEIDVCADRWNMNRIFVYYMVYESIYDLTHIGQKYAIFGLDFIIAPTIMELSRNTILRIRKYFNTCVNYRFYIENGSIIRQKTDRLWAAAASYYSAELLIKWKIRETRKNWQITRRTICQDKNH